MNPHTIVTENDPKFSKSLASKINCFYVGRLFLKCRSDLFEDFRAKFTRSVDIFDAKFTQKCRDFYYLLKEFHTFLKTSYFVQHKCPHYSKSLFADIFNLYPGLMSF